jgi:hypothetical protein
MILSKREHKIGLITIGVILILLLDRFLLTPYLKKREELILEKENLVVELKNSRKTLSQWKDISPNWENLTNIKGEDSEYGVINALRKWAEESGASISLLKPEGENKKSKLNEQIYQVVGTGSMRSISEFLWRMESSQLPLKIKNLQLAVRREGIDDLTLQVRVGELSPPTFLSTSNKTQSETKIKAEEVK